MPHRHRYIFIPESRQATMGEHCKNDYGNGDDGDLTWSGKAAFLDDPDDGSVVRYRFCGWNQETADYNRLRAKGREPEIPGGAARPLNLLAYPSHGPGRSYTFQEALDDTVLKSALKIVPVPEDEV